MARQQVQSVVGRQKSAVDLVLHEIRSSILSGNLPPGQPFTVPSLTARLGVSHVPVREALRQLEAQGLVVLSPSRSASVAPLDLEDLQSIYRLRQRLEPELAALSSQQRSRSDLAELKQLPRVMFATKLTEDDGWDMHRRFHSAIISPAAQAWDFRLLIPLWDAAERYVRLVFQPVEPSVEAANERKRAHDRLVSAAGSKDPEEVRNELHRHLEANLSKCLTAMRSIATGYRPSTVMQDQSA